MQAALMGGYSMSAAAGMSLGGGMGAAGPSAGHLMEELAAEQLRRQQIRVSQQGAADGMGFHHDFSGLAAHHGADAAADSAAAAAVAAATGGMQAGGFGSLAELYGQGPSTDAYAAVGYINAAALGLAGGYDAYAMGGLQQLSPAAMEHHTPEPAPLPHPPAPRGGSHGGGLRTKAPRGSGGDGGEAHSFRGVFWDKKSRRWRCQLGHKNKKIFLGYFNDASEAARAYDAKLVELNGANGEGCYKCFGAVIRGLPRSVRGGGPLGERLFGVTFELIHLICLQPCAKLSTQPFPRSRRLTPPPRSQDQLPAA